MRIKSGSGLGLALMVVMLSACGAAPVSHEQEQAELPRASVAGIQIPQSMANEHRDLHETLARATREAGELGAAAGALEEALAPHFKREEEIASPPLGLLPELARGGATSEMRAVLPMTDALERELPQMLREHDAIRAAVGKFRATAAAAKQPDYVRFADELAAHALQEEEILYPAAILVGRYVKQTTSGG